ncbi:MAG TPA: hypothetical protein VGX71_07595 [Pseudaminobacter sp.]|nr:hypothetical protein [Pseudaminobacter sp.]
MTVFPLDQAIHDEVMRELASAKTKYGPYHFEVLCIEAAWMKQSTTGRRWRCFVRSTAPAQCTPR